MKQTRFHRFPAFFKNSNSGIFQHSKIPESQENISFLYHPTKKKKDFHLSRNKAYASPGIRTHTTPSTPLTQPADSPFDPVDAAALRLQRRPRSARLLVVSHHVTHRDGVPPFDLGPVSLRGRQSAGEGRGQCLGLWGLFGWSEG